MDSTFALAGLGYARAAEWLGRNSAVPLATAWRHREHLSEFLGMRGFLKDGTTAALVVQDPYRMGYDGVKTALAVSKGEKVEANVDTGANLVTKDNMKEPKIDALLNPKLN